MSTSLFDSIVSVFMPYAVETAEALQTEGADESGTPHKFQEATFTIPTFCNYCKGYLLLL
jgi:hypothetical protein